MGYTIGLVWFGWLGTKSFLSHDVAITCAILYVEVHTYIYIIHTERRVFEMITR